MSLIEAYGPANKQRHQLPAVRSVKTFTVFGGVLPVWLNESIETESFSYVGMSEAAAEECYADMVIAYTKTKTIPSIVGSEIVYSATNECVADIKAVHVGGLIWDVNVEVNDKTITIDLFTPEA